MVEEGAIPVLQKRPFSWEIHITSPSYFYMLVPLSEMPEITLPLLCLPSFCTFWRLSYTPKMPLLPAATLPWAWNLGHLSPCLSQGIIVVTSNLPNYKLLEYMRLSVWLFSECLAQSRIKLIRAWWMNKDARNTYRYIAIKINWQRMVACNKCQESLINYRF